MKLSEKLTKDFNQEFNPTAYVLKKHIYGNKKKQLEVKKQNQAKKLVASLL